MNGQRLTLLFASVVGFLALAALLTLLGKGPAPLQAQIVIDHMTLTHGETDDYTCSGNLSLTVTERPTGVTINGPTIGQIDMAHAFTATVSPSTIALPITYVWQATDQLSVTHTSGLSHTIPFTWSTTGAKVITVTAMNAEGAVTGTHVITIIKGSVDDDVIESHPILDISASIFLDGPKLPSVNGRVSRSPGLVSLEDILPADGPPGTTAISYTPALALAMNDVVDARAVDFVHDETALVKGVVVGIETQDNVYEHDHAVCSRFHGYTVQGITPTLILGPAGEPAWFWHATGRKGDLVEEVFNLVVFVDEDVRRLTVDSRWRWDDYQGTLLDHDYILNVHIWAPLVTDAENLVRQTLSRLSALAGWSLEFANAAQPAAPTVIIREAKQVGNEIRLTLHNQLAETVDVNVWGTWRAYTDRKTIVHFADIPIVAPGVHDISLSFPQLLDAVVYTEDGVFGDKVYVGSGFWFVFDDAGEPWPRSQVTMTNDHCIAPSGMGADALIIPGCAQMSGRIAQASGYVGLGVIINPNGMPIDVSDHAALTFRACGDGRSYRLKIETESVEDLDFHEVVFTAPTEWRQFVIPLGTLRQRWGDDPVPFTGRDVKALVWAAEGPLPDPSVRLEIDQVAFFDSAIISNAAGPTSTNDVFGPYPVTARMVDDKGIELATLYYSLDGGNSFVSVPMSLTGGDVYAAQIPGQPMGTKVRYYLEAADGDGNVATDPPDAPWMTHHFRVEWYPSLLVDDYFDAGSTNLLGGDSGITQDDGTATASYEDGTLCLAYDVTNPNGYAVYYGLLKELDVRPYRSLSFRIKGAAGGERAKVGLNDGYDHEPKLEIGEHLPGGITPSWQTVSVPLAAFDWMIADWSQMHAFSLAFEGGIGSGQGTVCIDDVRFEPDALPIPLDNFDDLDCENGVGLLQDTDIGGGASLVVGYDQVNPYGGSGASLALTYDVPGGSHAAWHSGLGGLDVSSYDKLSFMVRGASGGENFHIWLVDQEGRDGRVNVSDYATVANTWLSTPVEISLQDFAAQGVNLTRLVLFKVAFEWTPMSGTIYLDDIRFVLPPSPTISAVSPTSVANDVPTTITISGQNFWMTPTVALGYYLLEDVTLAISTAIQATIPPGIPPDVYDVFVIQPNMQSGRLSKAMTMLAKVYLPVTVQRCQKPGF